MKMELVFKREKETKNTDPVTDAPDYIDIDVPAVYGRYYCRAWDACAYDPDTGRTVILNRAFVRPSETRAACVVRAYLYQGEAYCEILSGPTTYAQLEGINALKAIEDAICLDVPALHSWLNDSRPVRHRHSPDRIHAAPGFLHLENELASQEGATPP